ncbi:MAG: glycosyltransferase family 1 protein [Candidatus Moranbacteria bacterium]|nr:glycosyltransferase family 1 protein [Candidatus Moranbacteria bacterium]
MRIGIDARFYGSVGKGLGRYTEKLIEHLESLDTDNDYVVFLRRENFDEYVPKHARFRKALAQYAWYGFSEQLFFPFRLLSFRLDLVHFPHFNVPFLYPKRFIVTIHDLILLHYPTFQNTTRTKFFYWLKFAAYRFVIAAAIRRALHVIVVSHFTERDILDRYPRARGKVSVTYEAADASCQILPTQKRGPLFDRLGLLRGAPVDARGVVTRDILKPYLLYVGNAYPHKNLEALLRVAPLFPAYQFVLVGKEDYFYRRLKKTVEEQALRNVIFAGFLGDQELSTLYRFALCYVFPSLYEGFGLPPLEAMAHGLPVLSSRCGSLPEILGDAARYFDPHMSGSFETELSEMLRSEAVRQELSLRGYRQVARYSWDRMALETLRLYRQTRPAGGA